MNVEQRRTRLSRGGAEDAERMHFLSNLPVDESSRSAACSGGGCFQALDTYQKVGKRLLDCAYTAVQLVLSVLDHHLRRSESAAHFFPAIMLLPLDLFLQQLNR